MGSALGDIVRLGGLALQAEDCAIRAALHHRSEHGGVARMENERYHQFVIWRAVLPVWHAVLEREDSTDIIISRDGVKHYFELKNWRNESQLSSINRDVTKLRSREKGYLLITSGNPSDITGGSPEDNTESNLKHIIGKVAGLETDSQEFYGFKTETTEGREIQYWIAGWSVQNNIS